MKARNAKAAIETHILVIDCAERKTFWRELRKDYGILFATAAGEGLEMLPGNVRLVFLSLALHDTDCMALITLIKERYPSLPVIVIDQCDPEGPCMCMEAFKRGARDYMMKPLRTEDVHRKIETLLNERDVPLLRMPSPAQAMDAQLYPGIPSHLVSGVLKVKDFVAQNYSDQLSLAAACKMAATSKTYFCRFFKRITGHSLRSYHHAVKIQMAEQLLKDRKLSVTDVAIMVGYNDSNYFSTVYKKFKGISPRYCRVSDRELGEGKEGLNSF